MSNGIALPPIVTTAIAPAHSPMPVGAPWPAPNPAIVAAAQQTERNGHYSEGLWREMIIRITNEQKAYITNGAITGGFTAAFARDMVTMPFADNYICLNPHMSPAQALNYASRHVTAPGQSPTRFSGGVLTPVAALGHFLLGKGVSAETDINSLGLNLSSTPIPMLQAALATAPVGRTSILLNKVPYNTSSDSWMTASWLGNITLKIEGAVIKQENGSLVFSGGARAYNDIYDANPSTFRSAVGENATSVLSAVEKHLNATPYEIAIKGTNLIFISQ
ncbi:lipid II-degrading bacteriocin [Pseudomonas sp. PD9R]|uniref:lipid II-degrading bacteriocin n=1 Tax=Pseudomonas sp. PD9R TaxID=2853534 RepID=UPI001C47C144|nr:lipid II-degrading bacteriocin [Pseudomonas sp. PD9R]MBV6825827.1 lipid II-degrading bacteriocin [Pseudomonas sp. PD9R]